jgi:hypothetical protein
VIIAVHVIRLPTLPIVALALLAVVAGGCGSTVQEDTVLTVHASLPLSGPEPEAQLGRSILFGAQSALDDAGDSAQGAEVVLESSDSAAGPGQWRQATIAANARRATQDSTSIAYLGELGSKATEISAPITNEAGLLQVSPLGLQERLLAEPGGNDVPEDVQTTGERTLGTIVPSDLQISFAMATPESGGTRLGEESGPGYAYGYEAMAVILDSINRAEDPLDRADVVAAFLATTDREVELGTYSIGPAGAAVFEGDGPMPFSSP